MSTRSAALHALWSDPVRAAARAAAISEGLRRAWTDPDKAQRMRDASQTPEAIGTRRAAVLARLADPEYRARQVAQLRAAETHKHTPAFIASVRALWGEGLKTRVIAERLGVTIGVINGISERNDFPSRARVVMRRP